MRHYMSAHGAKELRVEISDLELATGSRLVDIIITGVDGDKHEISVYFDAEPTLIFPNGDNV